MKTNIIVLIMGMMLVGMAHCAPDDFPQGIEIRKSDLGIVVLDLSDYKGGLMVFPKLGERLRQEGRASEITAILFPHDDHLFGNDDRGRNNLRYLEAGLVYFGNLQEILFWDRSGEQQLIDIVRRVTKKEVTLDIREKVEGKIYIDFW